jgi:hypothetical protein
MKESTIHALTLDVCFGSDEEVTDVVDALVHETDVTADFTGVHVAGGWPEIKFSGTQEDLIVVANRYAADSGDTNEIISRIV